MPIKGGLSLTYGTVRVKQIGKYWLIELFIEELFENPIEKWVGKNTSRTKAARKNAWPLLSSIELEAGRYYREQQKERELGWKE